MHDRAVGMRWNNAGIRYRPALRLAHFITLATLLWPDSGCHAGPNAGPYPTGALLLSTAPPPPLTYDAAVVDRHQQLYPATCLPMCIEMVLKLTGHAPANYYELQKAVGYGDGRFPSDYDGLSVYGLTFHEQLGDTLGPFVSMDDFTRVVDGELAHHRFVIIGLPVGRDGEFASEAMPPPATVAGVEPADLWGTKRHAYVIVDRTPDGDYLAISKAGRDTIKITDVRHRVERMRGSGILTYTVDGGQADGAPSTRPSSVPSRPDAGV